MKKKHSILAGIFCLWLCHLKCQSDKATAKSRDLWLMAKSLFFLPAFSDGNSEHTHRKTGKWEHWEIEMFLQEILYLTAVLGNVRPGQVKNPVMSTGWNCLGLLLNQTRNVGKLVQVSALHKVSVWPWANPFFALCCGCSPMSGIKKYIYNLTAHEGTATLNSEVLR